MDVNLSWQIQITLTEQKLSIQSCVHNITWEICIIFSQNSYIIQIVFKPNIKGVCLIL